MRTSHGSSTRLTPAICVGAPIRDYQGKTVAAVSVTGLAHRMPLHNVPEIALSVIDTAYRISELLGYKKNASVPVKPDLLNVAS